MNGSRIVRFTVGGLTRAICLLACGVVGPGLSVRASAATGTDEEQIFKLREVSVFERNETRFLRGQSAVCRDVPDSEVMAYPRFASEKPVYGSVRFAGKPSDSSSDVLWYFAVDESRGTGKGYDRFHFDLDRDLDLRNDAVLKPQSRPPEAGRLSYSSIKQQVLFDFLSVPFAFGPDSIRPVELMPRLTISAYGKEEYRQVTFVRTRLYEGDIKVADKPFRALLGNDYAVLGPLDSPDTALVLMPKDDPGRPAFRWWGGDRLKAVHQIQNEWFTFGASPIGDRLIVRPYRGDLGIFGVGPGGRPLDKADVTGSLEAQDRAAPIGTVLVDGSLVPVQQCRIPVGDYLPNYLTVQLGRLRLSLSENYHSDGKPRDRGGRPRVYGMTVRKDRPYVLDFSGPPDVMFASPAKDQRIKVGDELQVKAVLVDPKLDIMIRGLDDTSRKTNRTADGQTLGYEQFVALDPKVVIRRVSGAQVAEGVMPFG